VLKLVPWPVLGGPAPLCSVARDFSLKSDKSGSFPSLLVAISHCWSNEGGTSSLDYFVIDFNDFPTLINNEGNYRTRVPIL
jgi:hypothetical protein